MKLLESWIRNHLEKRWSGWWTRSSMYNGYLVCSNCKDAYIEPDWYIKDKKWNYCPNCGVHMKGAKTK